MLADDLELNAARSDEVAARFRTGVDEYVRANGIEAPVRAAHGANNRTARRPDKKLDLRALDINTVIWASGYRLDFSWIDLDLETQDGYPAQTQGVSRYLGLYFMGLQLMHTRKSGLIFGVGEDAAYISGVIGDQLGLDGAA